MAKLRQQNGLWLGEFHCMASPCELLIEVGQQLIAQHCLDRVEQEAKRIEQKFSRYRDDNIIAKMNAACGRALEVDHETALLLGFAEQGFYLSDGLFDVTSGLLRQLWRFDGSDRLPVADSVEALLPRIGWGKVNWSAPTWQMPEGMEIDFGGIGKEYAVDRAFESLKQLTSAPYLINFGGDLRASGRRSNGQSWYVGVENPLTLGGEAQAGIAIANGALATSGDSRRYLIKDGRRYSHILNPITGWPVENAPRSVTVAGPTTIEAGFMATLASLQGAGAEAFLQEQGLRYWVVRD